MRDEGIGLLGPLEVHRHLLALQVAHELVHLPRVVASADELPDALGLPAATCVAVRVYLDSEGSALAVAVPAGSWPDEEQLGRVHGRPVRLAGPTAVSAATDFQAGLVCPLLLPGGLPLIADAALARSPVLYTATGGSGTALGIRREDLLSTSRARVVGLRAAAQLASAR